MKLSDRCHLIIYNPNGGTDVLYVRLTFAIRTIANEHYAACNGVDPIYRIS